MPIPTLLLSPDGSRDRNGPVTPTLDGSVLVVPGQYGNAWHFPWNSGAVGFDYPVDSGLAHGTMMFRVRAMPTTMGDNPILFHGGSAQLYRHASTNRWVLTTGTGPALVGAGTGPEGYGTVAVTWDGENNRMWWDEVLIGQSEQPVPPNIRRSVRISSNTTYAFDGDVESAIFFNTALPEAEIHRISTMPTAWTWEAFMPKIGGVRTTHGPAPFALKSTHGPAPFAVRSEHQPAPFALKSTHEEI